jgi:hypothetical protein
MVAGQYHAVRSNSLAAALLTFPPPLLALHKYVTNHARPGDYIYTIKCVTTKRKGW